MEAKESMKALAAEWFACAGVPSRAAIDGPSFDKGLLAPRLASHLVLADQQPHRQAPILGRLSTWELQSHVCNQEVNVDPKPHHGVNDCNNLTAKGKMSAERSCLLLLNRKQSQYPFILDS